MLKHEWNSVHFSWGGYIECNCGYRPQSQEEMDAHIPVLPPVSNLEEAMAVDTMKLDDIVPTEGSLKEHLKEIDRRMTEKWGPGWANGADW